MEISARENMTLDEWAEVINATAHSKGWWALPICKHEHEVVLGTLAWCEDCGSRRGLVSGTDLEWQAPKMTRERNIGEVLMLVVTEVAESYEEVRNHIPLTDIYFHTTEGLSVSVTGSDGWNDAGERGWKPEGPAVELADVIIRILDYAREKRMPLTEAMRLKVEYNKTRPFRHGGKAS